MAIAYTISPTVKAPSKPKITEGGSKPTPILPPIVSNATPFRPIGAVSTGLGAPVDATVSLSMKLAEASISSNVSSAVAYSVWESIGI